MERSPVVAFLAVCGLALPLSVFAGEIMVDKCSKEVAIVSSYDARPDSNSVVVLKRGSNGKTPWTPPFKVKLGDSGHIRWWCKSTSGNMFDAGTWRIEEIYLGTKCEIYADGSPQSCGPDANLKLGSSAWNGWTPERSRCGDRSRNIRARLDGGRKLLIECLGN